MRIRQERFFSFPVLVLASLLLLALWAPAIGQSLTETERVVAVEIPVQVLVDGKPVRGLTVDNFEVLDKGKKQRITGFEVVDLSLIAESAAGAAPGQPLAARRHFLFLFDLTFAGPGAVVRARKAAASTLDQMHFSDLAAVATYSVSQGPRLVLGFTSDRRQVRMAIETLGVPNLLEGWLDPLKLTLVDPSTMGREEDVSRPDAPEGRGGGLIDIDAMVKEHLRGLERGVEASTRANQRTQITNLARDFTSLARLMNSIEGRKHVIYLSQGFDSSLLFATADSSEIARMNRAAEHGEIWEVQSDKRFGNASAQSILDDMLEEFRRADCVIQTIDIGAAEAEDLARGKRSGTDGLFLMADQTGGEFYRSYNDLGQAMQTILEKTEVTYVLVFQPELETDGKYHKLKVRLKNAPRGAKVVHRPGYYAPRPFSEQGGQERQLRAAELILAGQDQGRFAVSVLSAPFKLPGDGSMVSVLVEVGGIGLLQGQQGPSLPTEIYGYALDERGHVSDFFGQQFSLDMSKVGEHLRQHGLKFYGDLRLPPGDYSLRVLVRNGQTGSSTLRIRPLTVPRWEDRGPVVLPPLFPEPRGKWVLVRETRDGQPSEDPFPFMIKDQPFLPAARPEVKPQEATRVCLVTYNLGQGPPSVEAEVLASSGDTLKRLTLPVHDRTPGATPETELLLTSFDPGELPQGEYRLVITVNDPQSGAEQSSSIPFVVTQ